MYEFIQKTDRWIPLLGPAASVDTTPSGFRTAMIRTGRPIVQADPGPSLAPIGIAA